MRSPLVATYNLMLEFNRAVSLDDVYSVILKHGVEHGVTSVLAGIIPDHIVKPSDQPGYVILGHWPREWAERYFLKQYVRRDPTILHSATQTEPLYWSDIHYDERQAAQKRIMEEARDFKLMDGITIPQLTIDGLRIGVSFSGEHLDKSPQAVTRLTVLAAYGVARALSIRAALRDVEVRLTRRERECLLWVSEGKTGSDVADLLGVTDKMVEKHLASARDKLDALTTTQAMAQALRLGLL